MLKVAVKINMDDLNRLRFAIRKVQQAAHLYLHDMQYYCSIDFQNLIIYNINNQIHTGGYPYYNEYYAMWKALYGKGKGTTDFWKLYGDLINSISAFKVGQTARTTSFFAGIPAGVYDSGGKSYYGRGAERGGRPMEIAQYGWWMEVGRIGQESRPMFYPTTEEYAQGQWIERGEEVLNKVKMHWS